MATYLGYVAKDEHLKKLYKTIIDEKYHVAFEPEKYQHIAITFHSSKGLEFEQVIVFAEDYRLSDIPSLCNHYVAVTRAKSKLIIVKLNTYNANCFQTNLTRLFAENGVSINHLIVQK